LGTLSYVKRSVQTGATLRLLAAALAAALLASCAGGTPAASSLPGTSGPPTSASPPTSTQPASAGSPSTTSPGATSVPAPGGPSLYVRTAAGTGRAYPPGHYPSTIALGPHEEAVLLAWSGVGGPLAVATGVAETQSCSPSCGAGAVTTTPIEVLASVPEDCEVSLAGTQGGAGSLETIDVYGVVELFEPARPAAATSYAACEAPSGLPGWLPVVAAAMADVGTPPLPLLAPMGFSVEASAPNSATVARSPRGYEVSLFTCPAPLPVNSPGIGSGTCGAMDDVYGGFGGTAYPSAAAAAAALPTAPVAPAGCSATSTAEASGGGLTVLATLWQSPSAKICQVSWRSGAWTFVLEGDLGEGNAGNGTVAWTDVAASMLSQLARAPLPGEPGVVSADVAPDGIHTTCSFVLGTDLYTASAFHQATEALALTGTLLPYPFA